MLTKPESCRACPFYDTGIGFVPPTGPPEARLRLIGEAPGEDEVEAGEPFVGKAGDELNADMATAGIARKEVWIGNTIQCRPPRNNYALVPREAVDYCQRTTVPSTPPGSVEVLVGGHALRLRLRGAESIQNWRGSVVPTAYGIAIPTLHPAFLFRGQWKLRGLLIQDLKAARDISNRIARGSVGERSEPSQDLALIVRELVNPPTLLDDMPALGRWLALDVETKQDHSLDIVGFSVDGQGVMQLAWEDVGALQRYIDAAEVVLAHNAPFDVGVLARAGVVAPHGKVIDTMLAQTMLRSDLEVGLNDSAAAMLPGRWAYHKALWGFRKDGREKETIACRQVWENILGFDLGVDNLRYRVYNSLDVAVTWRIWQQQQAELQ